MPHHRDLFAPQSEHAHAASIVALPGGDLLSCWFQGSGERTADDVRILGARLHPGETAWSAPFPMADVPNFPDCNPVLFLDPRGKLWMFWVTVLAHKWEYAILKYRVADDFLGEGPPCWRWQEDIHLDPGEHFADDIAEGFKALGVGRGVWAGYAPPYTESIINAARNPASRQLGWMTRIHPIVLPTGRILLPLYSDGFNLSLIAISDDQGATWRASHPIVEAGPIQPSLARRTDGVLLAFMRQSGHPPNRVFRSESHDDGVTWTPARRVDIPNPCSSLEVLPLRNSRWIMVCNDTEEGRRKLSILSSEDEGESWRFAFPLEDGEESYSYPSVIQTGDGWVHALYSVHGSAGKTIRHARFNPDEEIMGR